ncbi:hypothetical protein TeGR_g4496 [Tetraparma gracilis]|uniref:Uncharacterized protein n=1 Tax=Tetraparma gracilis TaxID=2962635 RepID=A0ABQ6MQK7_9STRA|nr:hypothetical protein TeGR_g4496 [Tetraparma gracilis]
MHLPLLLPLLLALLLSLLAPSAAFAPACLPRSPGALARSPPRSPPSPRASTPLFGGKQATFGVSSPFVYAAKLGLGEKKLQNLRGKAISLHSQAIGEFCMWSGSYHMRTRIIKKAKENGNWLGFLV